VFLTDMGGPLTHRTDWALLTRDPSDLRVHPMANGAVLEPSNPRRVLWTDAYSNVFALLKR
jgi:hypothetical protein